MSYKKNGEKRLSLDEKHIRQLIVTRYHLQLANDQASIDREPSIFAAISLLHDSLEAFLVTASDFLNANVKQQTDIPTYLDRINEKLPENVELPFRFRLLQLNKVRVNAKHHGVQPDRTELQGYLGTCRDFFEKATKTIFQREFWNLSLTSILDDGETKELLQECENSLAQKNYNDALTFTRKAFFLEFEKSYDIKHFSEGERDSAWFFPYRMQCTFICAKCELHR
ncbi:hypothetical protein N6L27_16840 [Leisingera sp. SS27]|uniref:hypothetical protein n=1 Tax=Leisingera sp. SS27 TaxID=2979462 RepID=UPI00232CB28A|nr:hypothetical protein [Leisingera sp. SS27]MDC0659671.1 hypothetical protein [Leisingera sp. SS27]